MGSSRLARAIGLAVCLAAASGAARAGDQAPAAAVPRPAAGAAAPASGAPADSSGHKHPETLLDFAVAGGWMMLPLCACSVVLVGFFLERLFVLRRGRIAPRRLLASLRDELLRKPFDRGRAFSVVSGSPSTAASVFRAALERLDEPPEKVEKAVQNVAGREVYSLRSNLWVFATLSTISPLLGLLGTVSGLVQAFREVAITGLGAGATLAPGIYEALVTTVAGLAIAIPSIAAYYWLQARVDRYVHEIDCLVVDLVDAAEGVPAAAASR